METKVEIGLTVGHVGLNVSDLERSKAFYADVFGLRVVSESGESGKRYAFLQGGRGVFVTLWEQSAGEFSSRTPGLHHLAFQAESLEVVREYEAKLRVRGTELIYDGVVPHAESAGSGGIFFRDPDGIRLEIYAPDGVTRANGAGEAPSGEHATCGFF